MGSESHLLATQDAELVERYVKAFTKVFRNLDAVLEDPSAPGGADG